MRLRRRLQANARRMLADDSAADDALQDAFYRLWKHRDNIVTDSQAEGMSVIAVRNTCIDALRKHRDSLTEMTTVTRSTRPSGKSSTVVCRSVKERS